MGSHGRSNGRAGGCGAGFQSLLSWISSSAEGIVWALGVGLGGFNPCCHGSALQPNVSKWIKHDKSLSFNPCCHGSALQPTAPPRSPPATVPMGRFNPCCHGSALQPPEQRPATDEGANGFNPCCHGSALQPQRSALAKVVDEAGFNPCCHGSALQPSMAASSSAVGRLVVLAGFQSLLSWISSSAQ